MINLTCSWECYFSEGEKRKKIKQEKPFMIEQII